MNRPEGSYFCLHRGRLMLRDDEDLVLTGYVQEDLDAENTKAEKTMNVDTLSEVLHWVVQDCPVGMLAPALATYIEQNFDIKLKKAK